MVDLRARSRAAWAAVRGAVGRDEVTLLVGLALVALGFGELWRPGSYLFPGGVLIWIALPTRHGFVHRPPAPMKGRR